MASIQSGNVNNAEGSVFRVDVMRNARTEVLSAESIGVPWYIWCAALAVTSAMIGAHWDISWHKSIGRDTFWTPAHIAIYMCGVLAGIAFGYIILSTTFSKSTSLARPSVHIWGFRAPLGAFIASWGGIAMLTSAPFDNWWHDAYGLDVKIISPPHILLFIGVYGVFLGTLTLIAGHMNRGAAKAAQVSRWLFLYIEGGMVVVAMIMLMEYTGRVLLHTSLPYVLVCAVIPIALAVGSRATGIRFAATFIAGFYTLFIIGLILVLPLFPAEPKLGPVYQHVTQFIPPEFPMLLIVPAFALDLLWRRGKNWNRLETGGGQRSRFCRNAIGLRVAVCGISDVAGGAESILWNYVCALWSRAHFVSGPQ